MIGLIARNGKGLILSMVLIMIYCVMIPTAASAADIDVYAEGAYTAGDLVVNIYADIHVPAILSFGVKLNYPAGLTFSSATKNETVWYFGDGVTNQPYMDPENDGSGVVIIGGKLDTAAPTAGVTGNRVLLGTVTFTHSGVTDFSGITLTYGRGDGTGTYMNFVGTDGTEYDGDGVAFTVEIHERGDANADGVISTADYLAIRNNLNSTSAPLWIDCNGDGTISTADYLCVRNNI